MIRVLIVDDDKLARMGLHAMLPWERYGMRVVADAANGAKALAILQTTPVDLVFVDIAMPVISGLELIRQARVLYPRLHFVALTFHEDFATVQSALRLGVLDYISKLELENANYDAICARIAQKLNAQLAPAEREGEPPDWEQTLYGLRWLYDPCLLESMSERMIACPVRSEQLVRMLVRAAVLAESSTQLTGPPIPTLLGAADAVEYLRAYRDDILEKAHAHGKLSLLSNCLLKAIYRVQHNLSGDLHTETIAARVGLSRAYFSSSFSKAVGLSFHAFVRRERMARAQKLLADGEASVAQIASEVGYEDARSFMKAFHEQTGLSPAAYRTQSR
ncbi:MAG: response regulator [Oscillospiraceae bacterium]|jgi:two-component system response regulator YesN|nr:response regulator [Oscillospiraceae bacterium]